MSTTPAQSAAATQARRLQRSTLALAGVVALAALMTAGTNARSWNGKTFPGFLMLRNRVVASVGQPQWTGARDGSLYQRTVVAVNGERVDDSAEVYRRVAEQPPGSAFTLTLRNRSATDTLTVESARFSRADWIAIFGSYLATSFLYLMLGLIGAWLFSASHLGRALLLLGSTGGIYALTAVSLYDGDAGIRIHALAEAFLPATFVYLALVFPSVQRRWMPAVLIAFWLSAALAVPYQLLLDQPGAYSILHGACEAYMGLAGLAFVTRICFARFALEDPSALLNAATAGALLGLGVPAVVMLLSGLTGGSLPVNVSTATAFFFPLCLGYGLVRHRFASLGAPAPAATV